MRKTLVWDIIQQFTNKETKDFRLFLKSPYFNTREDLLDLFDFLSENRNENNSLSRVFVFEKTFPDKIFSDQEMRLFLSYLLKLLEQFLVLNEEKVNNKKELKKLLQIYKKRNLNRHYKKTLHQAQKLQEKSNKQHPEHYLEAYYLEREEYRLQSKMGRTQKLNLQKVEDNLDSAFISFKLRQACFARAHEAVFNTQYDIRLIDYLLREAKKKEFQKIPAIVIYYHCYRALYAEPSGQNFHFFREELINVTAVFPQEEIRTLYLLAINYCIKKINKNEQIYLKEALDLYKSGLENDLLLENGKISRFAFNNIVGIALHLGDFGWTEKFVNQYKEKLLEEHREATFHLNSGRLDYARKKYKDALIHLQKADYRDILSNMVAKILQMKIYFELEEFDLLNNHLKTMEMYVRRNKKISYHYQNWMNIIRFTQKLVDVNRFDKKSVSLLKKAILEEAVLTEKKWLLGQLR